MKKKAIVSLILMLLCLIPIGLSLAHPTFEGRTTNVVTTGEVQIDIEETTDQGTEFVDLDGVMPNTVASKIVRIRNTREQPCWLRVRVDTAVKFAGEKTDPDYKEKISYAVDCEKTWLRDGDYYYYRSVLQPGEAPVLFEKVMFAPAMGNEYAKSVVSLSIHAEAVQWANNVGDGSENAVLSVKGWPASEAAETGGDGE